MKLQTLLPSPQPGPLHVSPSSTMGAAASTAGALDSAEVEQVESLRWLGYGQWQKFQSQQSEEQLPLLPNRSLATLTSSERVARSEPSQRRSQNV